MLNAEYGLLNSNNTVMTACTGGRLWPWRRGFCMYARGAGVVVACLFAILDKSRGVCDTSE